MNKLFSTCVVAALTLSHPFANASVVLVSPVKEWTFFFDTTNYRSGGFSTPKAAGNSTPYIQTVSYAKFNELYKLPDEEPDTTLTSAILTFTETINTTTNRYGLGVFGVGPVTSYSINNSLSSRNMVQLGQLPKTYGYNNVVQFDITDYLNSIYSIGSTIGFLVKSLHEGQDSSPDGATFGVQSMSLTFTPNTPTTPPNAVSEPDGPIIFASGLALLGCVVRFRRKKLVRKGS
jgi:hypothetical protein